MKSGLMMGVMLAVVTTPFPGGIIVGNQTANAQLPPPPPLSNPNTPPSRSTPIYTAPAPGERVFTAPSPAAQPTSNAGQYRVIVDSGSPTVLQQVRRVRPDAFFQNLGDRRVIQIGVYNDPTNARQQATRLSAQGIDAQILGLDSSGNSRRGYYAVVPGSVESVREYQNRAIRFGVPRQLIRLRDQPRGTHLAVGPFSEQRDAEQAVRYLRDRVRLDARLFYDR